MSDHPFVAADVGNARIKLGLFEETGGGSKLPEPLGTLPLRGETPEFMPITPWLADAGREELCWRIASVNRPAATRLIDWLGERRPADRVVLLACEDLPLEVRLSRPDMVGIDRLVDAVAANRLREPDRPAAIVDVGSAITVDLVSADGAFLGGAILPGIEMSARALHRFTDLLPMVDTSDLGTPPPPLGADTVSAIQSGLYWGAVGAIRQLVEQLHKTAAAHKAATGGAVHNAATVGRAEHKAAGRAPQVFLTGGAGAAVADLLGPDARHVPDLTLAGIALAVKPSATLRR